MIGLLVRCYPARWRARYGDEFLALLAERPLGPFDVADVLLGALDAHLHRRGLETASAPREGFGMSLRIGGWAAIGGGLMWFFALLGQAGPLALIGTALVMVALAGLSAFQARRHPMVVWPAFGVAAVGGVLSFLGIIGMDQSLAGVISGWDAWNLGMVALCLGSAMFAAVTLRTRSLPWPSAAWLGASSLVAMAGLVAVVTPVALAIGLREDVTWLLIYGSVGAFAAGWIGLGIAAVRRDWAAALRLQGT